MAEETEPDHCTDCGADVGRVRVVRPSADPGDTEFDLGLLVTTPGAMDLIRAHSTDAGRVVEHLVARHATGDWGEVDAEDARDGDRILSSYALVCADEHCGYVDHRLWLLTEADRSYTTLLRPEDY